MVLYRVEEAEPYRPNSLGTFGKASYMLIRQFQFPDTFSEADLILGAFSDRIGHDHYTRSLEINGIFWESDLERWVRSRSEEEIIALLRRLLKTSDENWTGFRVLCSISNGYQKWYFELFAKDPSTDTLVYTGEDAPNVLKK